MSMGEIFDSFTKRDLRDYCEYANSELIKLRQDKRERLEREEEEKTMGYDPELDHYKQPDQERIERKEGSMKAYHVEHILDELVDAGNSIDRAYAIAMYGGNDTVATKLLREASDAVAALHQELGVRLITKETT